MGNAFADRTTRMASLSEVHIDNDSGVLKVSGQIHNLKARSSGQLLEARQDQQFSARQRFSVCRCNVENRPPLKKDPPGHFQPKFVEK